MYIYVYEIPITIIYKKNKEKLGEINIDNQKIAQKLSIDNRTEIIQKNESYITLKDQKPGLPDKKTCRLINRPKTDIGKISKSISNKINQRFLIATKVNQWKTTSLTLEWLKNIDRKENCLFIKCYIENLYSLISIVLFNKAFQFAKKTCVISNDGISIII